MTHPDRSELVRYAAREPAAPGLEHHVAACPECAGELGSLGEVLGMLRATSRVDADRGPGCLGEHELAALAEGSLSSAAHEACVTHLAECARCRAAVASVARALASERVGRELRALERGRRPGWLHYALPAGAAAALLLLMIELPSFDRSPHREGPITTTPAPVTIAPAGPVRSVRVLRWHPVAGADRYRVTLFDLDGVVLHEASLSDQVVALPDAVVLEPGRRYFWSVAARTGWDRWVTSELVEFSVAGDAGR